MLSAPVSRAEIIAGNGLAHSGPQADPVSTMLGFVLGGLEGMSART